MSDINENDLFEDAQSDYVRIEDIDGRDVVIFPLSMEKGNGDSGPYDYLKCDVIVLNGEPTELMDGFPYLVTDMRLSSGPLKSNGARMLKKGPLPAFAGRINSQKGKFGKKAYGIVKWDDTATEIRALAGEETRAYREQALKAQAEVEDAAAF